MFADNFTFLCTPNFEACWRELSDVVLDIRDLVYGDRLGFGLPEDIEYVGSLLQPSWCSIVCAEALLLIPFDNLFSGRGGGVLDGEEED